MSGFGRLRGKLSLSEVPLALSLSLALSLFSISPAARSQDCSGTEPVVGEAITLALVHPLLNRPIHLTHAPDDADRLFVVQQRGLVRIIDLQTGMLASTPFLSLASKVSQNGPEQGLLSLAFHPDYQENGFFFVSYTLASSGHTVIARFSVSEDPSLAAQASEVVVLEIEQVFPDHNGGRLAFGPDGNLYIAMGDGGDVGDPMNNAQNPHSLLGKILRIDVDTATEGREYSVPIDNPYADNPDARDEIWALGLQDPGSLAFDSQTGDLYFTDNGQTHREEINFQNTGSIGAENYEWRRKEGTRLFNDGTILTAGFPTPPVFEYSRSQGGLSGTHIVGGVAYRGCALPDLHGAYFFADSNTHRVWSLRMMDGEATGLRERTVELNSSIPSTGIREISAIGVDARGEVYIAEITGKLFKIVPRDANIPPTARIRTLPDSARVALNENGAEIVLDSSASDDGDGGVQELSAFWEKIEGPENDEIENVDQRATRVTFSAIGTYVYQLTIDDGTDNDSSEVTVIVVESSTETFVRGDSNLDGAVDISDGVATLQFLFLGGSVGCKDATDANDGGEIDLTDAVFTFNYLFLGGSAPPAPGPDDCGLDPTGDLLEACEQPDSCL